MARKSKAAGCRLPKAVEILADFSEDEAAAQPPVLLLKRDDGGYARYRLESGQVRCGEADSAAGESRPGALEALLASGRRNFRSCFRSFRRNCAGRRPTWTSPRRRFATGRSAAARRPSGRFWSRLTASCRLRPARAAARRCSATSGNPSGSRPGSARSRSSEPTIVARTAAAATSPWTARSGSRGRATRRARRASSRTRWSTAATRPPRAASSRTSPACRLPRSRCSGRREVSAGSCSDSSARPSKRAIRRRRGPTCRSTARAFAATARTARPRPARRRYSSSIRRRGGTRRPASRKRTPRQRDLERLHRQRRRRRRCKPQL